MERLVKQIVSANKELLSVLWIILALWLINLVALEHRTFLNIYTLPVLFAAYFYGKRLGTLSALLCFLFVVLLTFFKPGLFAVRNSEPGLIRWLDIVTWGGFLILTGYAMGTLYESKERKMKELRETYYGVLELSSYLLSKDNYTQTHSYRTAVYSLKIGRYMGLDADTLEDIRAAALLHDIGKLEVSRSILYKAAELTEDEYEEMKTHTEKGALILKPVGGTLKRVIPIILSHHEKEDGTGYHGKKGKDIPLEAKVIAVADYYDALVCDRPYRKALPPWEVKEAIVKGAGKEFDPRVVDAFVKAYDNRELEVFEVLASVIGQ